MNLRPELQPRKRDNALAARLAELASKIDGARPGEWEELLAEFNKLAPDYDDATNTWGGGRMMGEYDPTPEQIVDWALQPDTKKT